MNSKKMVALLSVLMVCAMVFAACGGTAASAEGKYVISAMKESSTGMEITGDLLATMLGGDTEAIYIELKSGNNFVMVIPDEKGEGTYELSGETLKLTVDGDTQECTLKDNVISMSMSTATMEFTKK
ncbi:hypothetical protein LJC27_05840, partial [Christensenellaceae bacterium OttesenSCG-928-M15]|nr:hypothetical protein [Christensenellaceae bacterium OttesenSCG-928-M15]